MSNRTRVGFRLNRTGCIVLVFAVLTLVLACIGTPVLLGATGVQFRVEGFAMEPSLRDGSFVLINRQAYLVQSPRRGDIVVYHRAPASARFFVSRIIGLPRERVQMKAGRAIISGSTLREPYVASLAKYEGEWILKDGEYFVLGDNRNASSDSHSLGPVPASSIQGKAEWVYWPPQFWGGIAAVSYAP